MRILVTGCREWQPWRVASYVLESLMARHGPCVIVHGSASGVDTTFHDQAIRVGHDIEPHPADWKAHGKGAGPKRNAEMVAKGADFCIAVHRDIRRSKGTKDCARRAIRAGIPTWLIDSDKVPSRPRRLMLDDLECIGPSPNAGRGNGAKGGE